MLTTAVKAARRAGNVITRGARDLDLLTVTAKGPKDFVSEVDRAAEAAIVETLLGAYPDHAIHAEEGTERGRNPDAEHVWIIDPLDGTTNFLHGFPQYCVSIALAHRNVITQGVIYDPVRNDLFTATRGRAVSATAMTLPASASSSVATTRASSRTRVAPAASAVASGCGKCRGATSTRRDNPIVSIARAAAPMFAARLVATRTTRKRSRRATGIP